MRLLFAILLSASPLALACTTSSTDPVKSPEGGATTGAAPTTDPTAGQNAPTGGRVAANSPLGGKDERAGTVRNFAGDDPGLVVRIPGKRAWTLGPGDSWTISLYDFVRTEGSKNIFKGPAGEPEFAIPGAYTHAATATKGLAKGAPVLVAVEADTACGRVVSASETEIKVAIMADDKRVEKAYAPDEVFPLDGKADFAAPVAYKQNAGDLAWTPGVLVRQDSQYAWLQGATRVAPALVKPLDVTHAFKVGDKVFAVPNDGSGLFVPATITKVLNEGLEYELQGKDGVVDYCSVTSSL